MPRMMRMLQASVLVEYVAILPLILGRILIITGISTTKLKANQYNQDVVRLLIINLAVIYNLVFVIGRAIFWQLQNLLPIGWYFFDYLSDLIYILDIIVRCPCNQILTRIFF